MITLYKGADNATNFLWEEDSENDRCRMIDWDFDDDMLAAHVDEFKTRGLSESEYGDWRPGIYTIRGEMNGFSEVAWRL